MVSKSSMCLLVCVAFMVIVSQPQNAVQADVHIGSCVWGAVDYTSNCNEECKRRGHKGGHCGSFANVNCWCLLVCANISNAYILLSANIEDIKKVANKFLSSSVVEQLSSLISKIKTDAKNDVSEENTVNENTVHKISDDELEERAPTYNKPNKISKETQLRDREINDKYHNESVNKGERERNKYKVSMNKDDTKRDRYKVSMNKDDTERDRYKVSMNKDDTERDRYKVSMNKDDTERERYKESMNKDDTERDRYKVSMNKDDTERYRYKVSMNKGDRERDRYKVSTNKDDTERDRYKLSMNKDDTERDRYKVSMNKDDTERDRYKVSMNKGDTERDRYKVSMNKDDTERDRPASMNKHETVRDRHKSESMNKDEMERYRYKLASMKKQIQEMSQEDKSFKNVINQVKHDIDRDMLRTTNGLRDRDVNDRQEEREMKFKKGIVRDDLYWNDNAADGVVERKVATSGRVKLPNDGKHDYNWEVSTEN